MDPSAGLSFYGSQAKAPAASAPPPAPQPLGGTPPAPPTPQAAAPSSPAPAPLNPQAGQLQNQGRGTDTQLVHMTPDEVNSLRGLAQRFGGDLTTNPQTGLPEAGWLGKLLPTLLGVGASFIPGVGPLMAAGLVGAGQTALTGDLGKGLTAGLQAFGGASLGGALGAGGAASGASGGLGALPTGAPSTAINAMTPGMASAGGLGAGANMTGAISNLGAVGSNVGSNMTGAISNLAPGMSGAVGAGSNMTGDIANMAMGSPSAAAAAAPAVAPAAPAQGGGFLDKFKAASRDLPGSGPGMNPLKLPGKVAPWAAGAGLLSTLSDVTASKGITAGKEKDEPYTQMKAAPRKSIFDGGSGGDDYNRLSTLSSLGVQPLQGAGAPGITPPQSTVNGMGAPPPVVSRQPFDSSERTFFDEINPNPRVVPFNATAGKSSGEDTKKKKKKFLGLFAEGGGVFHMETGGHVFPAFDVATFGNGSSDAGMAKLAKLGGIPIKGKGDGVSDSIPAMIDGKQKARVANGEVYFPAAAVEKAGGTKKLYAMMSAAEKARKKTASGEKVRGLA